ncbi:MAG: DUF1854 domain-containing protein [Methylophilaceae bacterium]
MNQIIKLTRNSAGQLALTDGENITHVGVYPVRAFPISAPNEGGLSLLNKLGHEVAWIKQLNDLPSETKKLIEDDLADREFMPEIIEILRVYSFAMPSHWLVNTDRGATELILKSEDHIRKLTPSSLLITDSQGVNLMIRDIEKLNKQSRKLLDRFL